ncbi:Bax inhibitor-1/YccA family protein [Sphingomonas sp. MMS24-J13]|uniref:Bax inhibitor-1/YccA family protein n=1 Tax=Sphingomonas sp. MMS24-J13 TaxID=3238686 RepID=UPI00384F60DA
MTEGVRQDPGLRDYMTSVYLRMTGGVAASSAASWLVAHDDTLSSALFTADGLTILGWIVTFAPLGLVLLLSAGINRLSAAAAGLIFLAYAVLVGLSLGGLLLAYTGTSLATTFIATAAGFAALAWAGMVSRRDLSGLGAFFTIGLVGLIVAMLVNLFVRSTSFDMALSAVGVLLFAGLTAFDAQRVKRLYYEAVDEGRDRSAIIGALTLYLDFLNLFLFLLRFTGERRQ